MYLPFVLNNQGLILLFTIFLFIATEILIMNQSSWPGWSCRLEHEQKSAMLDIVRWNIYFWKFRHVSWISKHSSHQGTDKVYWLQFWEFLGLEISFWLWSSIVNQISHQSRISWLIVEHLRHKRLLYKHLRNISKVVTYFSSGPRDVCAMCNCLFNDAPA